jgi:hypothetical protein
MSLLCFMEEEPISTPLDEEVKDFLAKLPAGDDRVGCNYIQFAFEHRRTEPCSLEEFEAAVARVAPTSTVYGRLFVEGVDAAGVMSFYRECFQ